MRLQTIPFIVGVTFLASPLCFHPARGADPNPPATAPAANVVRVYDVQGLIVAVPDFDDEPDFSPQPAPDSPVVPQPGGGLFNDGAPAKASGPTRQEVVEQLLVCLKRNITPEAWTTTATMSELHGQLTVSAPPATHRELRSFSDDVQRRMDVQVTLAVNVLDLHKLEKLKGLHPDLRKKLRAAVSPFGSRTGFELTADEVRQIDRATEPTERATMVTTPRVTLFNGQRAYILVATQRAFVAGYKAKPAGNGFDPQVKIAETGELLAMQAGVSEDHKQVAVNLTVKLSDLRGMAKAPFAGAPAETGLMIDVPDVRVRSLRTTISVGDQRTVVLGGFRDVSKEVGWNPPATQPAPGAAKPVPDKDHVPMFGDDLIVLVKPTVIIEHEEKVR